MEMKKVTGKTKRRLPPARPSHGGEGKKTEKGLRAEGKVQKREKKKIDGGDGVNR